MKCMACGYDPSVIKDRLELYSKKHLPDDKLFLELDPIKAKDGKLLRAFACPKCGIVQISVE